MRALVLIAFLALIGMTSSASARDYPVCLRVYTNYHDWYDECSYTSIAQCQMSASGRSAQCMENPFYAGPARQPAPRARNHRRPHR
jgi:hypothetical protein